MAMTPEQIQHREFPVRLKGYDPDEVRRFLDQVAAVFRVAVADDEGRAPSSDGDLAQVLAAANVAADKVIADAERQASALVTKADAKHARADEHAARAQKILERAQARSAAIADDCRDARQALTDAEAKAADIVAQAQEDAAEIALTERTKKVAAELDGQLEARMQASMDQVDAAADAKLAELDRYVAECRLAADQKAARIIAAAEARADELAAHEHALQTKVSEAQAELRKFVARFAGDDVTIDLTHPTADHGDGDGDGATVVAFEGTYTESPHEPEPVGDEYLDDELFPDLHDDDGSVSDVRLEWNKPPWARPARAVSVSP